MLRPLFKLTWLALMIPAIQVGAQTLDYRNYTEQSGLPSQEVYDIYQDKKGFLWFATDNGIARFDGGNFKHYGTEEGLTDPVVFSFSPDAAGRVWYRTFSGSVGYFSGDSLHTYPFNDTLRSIIAKSVYYSIRADSAGNLFVSVLRKGLFRIDVAGRVTELSETLEGLFLKRIPNEGEMIGYKEIGGRISKFLWQDSTFDIPDPPGANGPVLQCRWHGKVYFSNYRNLYSFDGSKVRRIPFDNGTIISMQVDRSNHLWIGCLSKGVVRFEDEDWARSYAPAELSGLSVTRVLQDLEGGYWFATLDRGVLYVPNLGIEKYPLDHPTKVVDVSSSSNLAIICHQDGFVSCWDTNKRMILWEKYLGEPVVSSFIDEPLGQIWFSMSSKLMILSTDGKLIREHLYVAGGVNFNGIKKIIRHGSVILGVNIRGVMAFDRHGNFIRDRKTDFWCRNFEFLGDQILMAGLTGLHRSDTLLRSNVPIDTFKNVRVTDMALMKDGRVLVGTLGAGLYLLDQGGGVERLTRRDSFIRDFLALNTDSLVVSGTEQGLMLINPSDLSARSSPDFRLVGLNTGAPEGKVTELFSAWGNLWCITSGSIYVLQPGKVMYANLQPAAFADQAYVNEQLVRTGIPDKLSYTQNSINLRLSLISFSNRRVVFRYRLGPSEPWVVTPEPQIRFFSLPPAAYLLEVQLTADGAQWREATAPVAFTIHPPWWQTNLFRVFLVLLIALVVFLTLQARYRRRILKLSLENRMKAEKERIARDLHDNIGARLSVLSIDLRLATRSMPAEHELVKLIHENVSTTITELRDTIWAMQPEGITLHEFVTKVTILLEQIPVSEGLEWKLSKSDIPETVFLSPAQAMNLYRIFQEALNNSRRHAGARNIRVDFEYNESTSGFGFVLSDDGCGFDQHVGESREHYGLRNMHVRAAEIFGDLVIESTPNLGTTVSIMLVL
ncbi:MAG: hypothetical protein K1X47_16630 [Cyclobacteriaceae bacterium]|nr:hypothetical protein [Cyclobacteriaceae bacterium]